MLIMEMAIGHKDQGSRYSMMPGFNYNHVEYYTVGGSVTLQTRSLALNLQTRSLRVTMETR